MEELHRVRDEGEEPPREVEPPERLLLGDHAGGSPLPALRGQGAAQVVLGPPVAARAEAEEPGALAALVDLELGGRVVVVVGGDEADAPDAVDDGHGPAAAPGDALAVGRGGVALLVAAGRESVSTQYPESPCSNIS